VLFRPRLLDRLWGAYDVSLPRAAVAAVEVVPRTWGLFDGGLRRRLAVQLVDGAVHLFVVNGVSEFVTKLRSELGEAA
jgi:hypothetical protein